MSESNGVAHAKTWLDCCAEAIRAAGVSEVGDQVVVEVPCGVPLTGLLMGSTYRIEGGRWQPYDFIARATEGVTLYLGRMP